MESETGIPGLKTFQQSANFTVLKSGLLNAPETDKAYVFQFAMNIPCPGKTSINYEGREYSTLQILSQCWLKENLNVGTMIEGTIEQSNNRTMEQWRSTAMMTMYPTAIPMAAFTSGMKP
jgi:hypothetical protein